MQAVGTSWIHCLAFRIFVSIATPPCYSRASFSWTKLSTPTLSESVTMTMLH